MALIADTSGIVALYDRRDANHTRVLDCVQRESGPIIVPSAILAEIDYMLRVNLGIDAELQFFAGFAVGAYTLESFTSADLLRCRKLIETYRDHDLGLCDAAVIATAERLRIYRILTIDERDFRLIEPPRGAHFVILPADL